MRKILAGAAVIAAVVASAPAYADSIDFLWQWTGSQLNAITTDTTTNTVLQNVSVGTQYTGNYYLFNQQTVTSDFGQNYNFYDGSNLVFTYAPSGSAGNAYFAVPILNSVNGPLTPLAGGTNIAITGGVQDLLTFQGGADTYTLQFQDQPTVPEPASWAMMLSGFAAIGFGLRRRARVAVSFG